VLLVQGPAEAIDVDDVGHATVEANVSKGRLVVWSRDRRRWWSGSSATKRRMRRR
jgi:hypothetical protein